MTRKQLFARNLTYYWRTNLAVIAGVAAAVAVLAGALLVGDSVRASLRDLVLLRLGATSFVITSENFFREDLAEAFESSPEFESAFLRAAPLIALDGVVTHETSGRRASGVLVYGVDSRFWLFHGKAEPSSRTPSGPVEFESGRRVRHRVRGLPPGPGGKAFGRAAGFASQRQGWPWPNAAPECRRNAWLGPTGRVLGSAATGGRPCRLRPMADLQRDLDQAGRVNGILVSEPSTDSRDALEARSRQDQLEDLLRATYDLDDLDVDIIGTVAEGSGGPVLVESGRVVLDDRVAEAARGAATELGWQATGVFTYLANTIRIGDRETPYSLVAALDGAEFRSLDRAASPAPASDLASIWLNDWARNDLDANAGDTVELDYYVWHEGGRLETRTADFVLRGSVGMTGLGGDRTLAPTYPGLSDSATMGGWDPPFPVDLGRVRDQDEEYWDQYRTAPRAFLRLEVGQELWRTRYGQLTSVRLTPPPEMPAGVASETIREKLREKLDPIAAGMVVYPARQAGTESSSGAIDFGLYFISFSFFLVMSAVLLASLFFRLGIEQRLREIGLLAAIGFPRRISISCF